MIRSLQIIDTLNIGGAEKMAVNIANSLSMANIESHISSTRDIGYLKSALKENVSFIFLKRTSTMDIKAVFRFKKYIKKNKINIIHAHGTSFFFAVVVKFLVKDLKLVWHEHHGNRVNSKNTFKVMVLKLCSFFFDAIYCVNNDLKDWATKNLYCANVKFMPNYPATITSKQTSLNGKLGKRILCLANLREPKNHILLFKAFKSVNKYYKDWSLHCVGKAYEDDYSKELENFIKLNELENSIFLYGPKTDTSSIITQADIGVLTSKSEGLPMVLLEYGLGKLPIIATDVGYCRELISKDSYGILIDSNDEKALVSALNAYIKDRDYRSLCAANFHNRVVEEFSERAIIQRILRDYNKILGYSNS